MVEKEEKSTSRKTPSPLSTGFKLLVAGTIGLFGRGAPPEEPLNETKAPVVAQNDTPPENPLNVPDKAGDEREIAIKALAEGRIWKDVDEHGTTIVTYTFDSIESNNGSAAGDKDHQLLTQKERQAVRKAMAEYENVGNLKFVDIKDIAAGKEEDNAPTRNRTFTKAHITIRKADLSGHIRSNGKIGVAGHADYPSVLGSDVVLDAENIKNLKPGGWGYEVVLHELGHVLGLKHPFKGEGSLSKNVDNNAITVMSYTDAKNVEVEGEGVSVFERAITPQIYDMAAIQHLYGPNPQRNQGDTRYALFDGKSQISTRWDSGDVDTLNSTGYVPDPRVPGSGNVILDLREGAESITKVGNNLSWNAVGANIERTRAGMGDDVHHGNDLDNRFEDMGGNNRMYGRGGNDMLAVKSGDNIMDGGPGNDTYIKDDGYNILVIGEGNDRILNFDPDRDVLQLVQGSSVVSLAQEGKDARIVLCDSAGKDSGVSLEGAGHIASLEDMQIARDDGMLLNGNGYVLHANTFEDEGVIRNFDPDRHTIKTGWGINSVLITEDAGQAQLRFYGEGVHPIYGKPSELLYSVTLEGASLSDIKESTLLNEAGQPLEAVSRAYIFDKHSRDTVLENFIPSENVIVVGEGVGSVDLAEKDGNTVATFLSNTGQPMYTVEFSGLKMEYPGSIRFSDANNETYKNVSQMEGIYHPAGNKFVIRGNDSNNILDGESAAKPASDKVPEGVEAVFQDGRGDDAITGVKNWQNRFIIEGGNDRIIAGDNGNEFFLNANSSSNRVDRFDVSKDSICMDFPPDKMTLVTYDDGGVMFVVEGREREDPFNNASPIVEKMTSLRIETLTGKPEDIAIQQFGSAVKDKIPTVTAEEWEKAHPGNTQKTTSEQAPVKKPSPSMQR